MRSCRKATTARLRTWIDAAWLFHFTIDDFVMAITAAAAAVRHVASHRTSGMRPIHGRLVMIAMVTFTLFALALALPGLVTLAMCDATEVQ